jgi:hypothetical protein
VASPDDVIPELPPLPPGSEWAYLDARRHEIFAPLDEADIPRLARFGEPRSDPDGTMLFEVGKPGPGMYLLLSGRVTSGHRDASAAGSGRDREDQATFSPRGTALGPMPCSTYRLAAR